MKNRITKWHAIVFIALMIGIFGGLGQRVWALSWELPDRDNITDPGTGAPPNGGVMITIAQPGSFINLDVNEAWAKVFYDPGVPDVKVQLFEGDFAGCGTNTADTEDNNAACSDPNAVNYEFYYGDPATGGTSPGAFIQSINSGAGIFGPGWDNTPAFPLPAGGPIDTGSGMKYVVYVRAVWAPGPPPGGGRINGFKVAGVYGGGLTSYWGYSNAASGQPGAAGYSVQDRTHDQYTETNMDFQFASPCSVTTGQTVWLKWTDADAESLGGIPTDGADFGGDNEISFVLEEVNLGDSSGPVILSINSGTAPNIGGNGDYREASFVVRPDKGYIWRWRGVNRFNGVQMWIPYDSYHFSKSCTPPTPAGPNIATVCQIDGTTAFTVNWDPANNPPGTSQYYVDVGPDTAFTANNYWNKGPIALGTNSASGPSGFNRWPQPPTIAMPELEPGQSYYARIYYEGPNIHSAPQGPFTTACAPPQLTCNSFNPPGMEQGSPPFTMTVGFSNAPFRTRLKDASVSIRLNTTYGAQAVSPNPLRGNSSTTTSNTVNVPPAGTYTVSLIFTGGNTPGSPLTAACPGEFQVYNRPYFRVFGGDVLTGGYDAIGCPAWPQTLGSPGSIFAFNNANGRGAGTQLLVQAMAAVNGFSSAQHRTGNPPYPPPPQPAHDKGLTFANTGPSQFGGAFNIGSCPPDYFANKPSAFNPSPLPILNLPALQIAGPYLSNTPSITLPLDNIIGNGKTITQYVNGDAWITGNIRYENTTWGNVRDIPSYTLIAKGDIYIASTVTRLDGIYIAQPRSAAPADGGTIYTCSVTPPSIPNALQIANQCTSPLTFNGAVLARTIKLFRSTGTVREANPADCPLSLPASNIYNCTGSSTAAEQFIYTPEIWIRSNSLRRPPRPATYDVISNLPPIL